MEISAAIVTQNTVDAIMKDYNAKMVQLVEGIQNRDKALEGLNKQVETVKAENGKLSLTVAALKTRYPDDVVFLEKEDVTDKAEAS